MTRRPPRSILAAVRLAALVSVFAASGASAQAMAFRFTDLDLRDPHAFAFFFVCADITDNSPLGFSVNGELQDRIRLDDDGDGLLDLSYLVEFLPLDRAAPANLMDFGLAECSAPIETTTCSSVLASAIGGDASLQDTGTCSAPLTGTTRPYTPAVASSTAACFGSPAGTIALDLAGIPVSLRDATVAATFVGDPGDGLVNGLLRGFISESDADAVILPSTLPVVGGRPLSSLLPGGTGNCAPFSDKDTLEGVVGWWFHLNFEASRVELVMPADVFRDGFETP